MEFNDYAEQAMAAMSGDPSRDEAMRRVMEASFFMTDLALYLDTHPKDQKAFALFQKYAKKAQEARAAYEEKFGPLTHMGAANEKSWTWIDNPWPWDRD